MAANFLGSGASLAQQLAWHDVRITLKWSFHLTSYAQQRPNVLGRTVPERWLKGYNDRAYWPCTDVGDFLKPGAVGCSQLWATAAPKWDTTTKAPTR